MAGPRTASTLLIVAAIVLLGGPTDPPNDSVFKGRGEHLVPAKETQIDLQREVLNLDLRGSDMFVDVHFEFFNPGSTRTLTVGFVTPPVARPGMESEELPIQNFTAVMNGDEKEYEVDSLGSDNFDSGFGDREKEGERTDYVYHFTVQFKPGLNVLKHSYTYGGTRGSMGSRAYDYRLTTGTNWADGTIEEFTLNLDVGGTIFTIPASFEQGAESSAWEVVGRGRTKRIEDEDPPMLEAYTGSGGYLTFHKEDFSPDRDFSVEYKISTMMDVLGPLPLQQSMPPGYSTLVMGGSKEKKMQDLKNELDASELRVLRNSFFAVRGYDFDDEALQARFEEYLWYVPDPEADPASFDLSEEEAKWIKRLKKLEKQKREE